MVRLLLDENIPVQFRDYFGPAFDVYTVRYMGWSSLEDSDLLAVMPTKHFDFLVTVDKRLHIQHNLDSYPFQLITLLTFSNRLPDLLPFIPLIEKLAETGFSGKNMSIPFPA